MKAGPSAERERAVGGAIEEERDGGAAGAGRRGARAHLGGGPQRRVRVQRRRRVGLVAREQDDRDDGQQQGDGSLGHAPARPQRAGRGVRDTPEVWRERGERSTRPARRRPPGPLVECAACQPPRPGGSAARSTRSIPARSPTRTATAWATCAASRRASTTSPRSASRRCGCRRSSPRRWPTSATTCPTTATSTRCSARSPTSTRSSPRATSAGSAWCSTGCRTTARTGTRGSRRRAASRDDPKRDWYVWRDAAPGGGPPNDWRSVFARCGARVDVRRAHGQWYLHSFMPEQPDLNWDNPEVEAAMHDVLRFWLDRGMDGFRLDAIAKIAKDPLLRDNGRRAPPPRRGLGHHPRPPARDPPGRRRVRGPHDRRRGHAARPAPRRQLPASPATSCTWRTTSCSPSCPGTPRRSAPRSTTSRRSPRARPGRRGSSPTTTCPAWRAASTRRPGRRRAHGRSR